MGKIFTFGCIAIIILIVIVIALIAFAFNFLGNTDLWPLIVNLFQLFN
ncbi:hypothetical protein [Seinonella peptonophila]|nr:hypothetical protein [Seinonella peptonophila]